MISSVNITRSAGNCEFGHIYWKKNCWKVLSIVQYHFKVKHTSKCLCYENQTCLFNFYLQFLYNTNSQFWRWIKKISNSHRPSGAGGGGKTEATSAPPSSKVLCWCAPFSVESFKCALFERRTQKCRWKSTSKITSKLK